MGFEEGAKSKPSSRSSCSEGVRHLFERLTMFMGGLGPPLSEKPDETCQGEELGLVDGEEVALASEPRRQRGNGPLEVNPEQKLD